MRNENEMINAYEAKRKTLINRKVKGIMNDIEKIFIR